MPLKPALTVILTTLLVSTAGGQLQAADPSINGVNLSTIKKKLNKKGVTNLKSKAPAIQSKLKQVVETNDPDAAADLVEEYGDDAEEAAKEVAPGQAVSQGGSGGAFPALNRNKLKANVQGAGGATGKSSSAEGSGTESGNYAGLMSRPPYIGTAEDPCRWGPATGRCTHEGKPLAPPPSPAGFKAIDVDDIPFYPGTNHRAFALRGHKYAIRFKGRTSPKRFPVHFDSPNGFVPRSAMNMWVAISEKAGDYNVAKECLVLPDMLTNGWAGGAAHSVARIEVSLGPTKERGVCALKTDGRDYYINVAGDCSKHWSGAEEYVNAVAHGCVTDLVNVNGWIQALAP